MTTPSSKPRRRWIWIGLLAGVCSLGVCAAGVIAALNDHGTTDSPPAMDQYGAEVACQSFVKDQTRQDATISDEHLLGDPPYIVFIVQGHVDAGDLHRTYTCTVKPEGSEWVLVTLDGLTG